MDIGWSKNVFDWETGKKMKEVEESGIYISYTRWFAPELQIFYRVIWLRTSPTYMLHNQLRISLKTNAILKKSMKKE